MNKINKFNPNKIFEEDLIISDSPHETDHKEVQVSENLFLSKEAENLMLWGRKQNERYTNTQTMELEEILNKYRNNHQAIRKFLWIPSSSSHTIKKKLNQRKDVLMLNNLDSTYPIDLDDKEKMFIRKLLNPPAYPVTIIEI